jgi:hypothetical protein
MKLLEKQEYKTIESLLENYDLFTEPTEDYLAAMKELIEFFDVPVYRDFLDYFYFNRHKYKNRYPDNRSMFSYLRKILFVQEPTLYMVRKEIVYKSAMLFYKYNVLEKEVNQ